MSKVSKTKCEKKNASAERSKKTHLKVFSPEVVFNVTYFSYYSALLSR